MRRGQHGALGLDVNQHNCICRISPGSAAAQDGHLRPGDVVHEVDAKPLLGFCLATSIDPALQAYVLRVYRPPFDALSIESITSGVMSTMKLQRVAQGATLARGAQVGIRYVSHAGRQLEGDSPRERIKESARQNKGAAAAQGGEEEPDLHALKSWAVSDLDAFIAQGGGGLPAQATRRPAPKEGTQGASGAAAEPDDIFDAIDASVQRGAEGGGDDVLDAIDSTVQAQAAAAGEEAEEAAAAAAVVGSIFKPEPYP